MKTIFHGSGIKIHAYGPTMKKKDNIADRREKHDMDVAGLTVED